MALIADILLAAGALGAGLYCYVLGRRLKRFNDLEKGVGGAVAVLSAQVDDLTKTLSAAQTTATHSAQSLTELTARAEACARQLELHMAALHDLPPERASEYSAPDPQPDELLQPKPTASPETGGQPLFTRRRAEGRVA